VTPSQSYREIPLAGGKVAIVDAAVYPRLAAFKWRAIRVNAFNAVKFYAVRGYQIDNKLFTVLMHREVLGIPAGDPREVDHIRADDTLDNRVSNLRIASHKDNGRNSGKRRDSTYRFKGVARASRSTKYRARIRINGKQESRGYFETQLDAHLHYCVLALQHYGEFANFGEGPMDVTKEEFEAVRKRAVEAEIALESLTNALTKANAGFEEHERKWYLATDEVEKLKGLLREWRGNGSTMSPAYSDLCKRTDQQLQPKGEQL